MKRLITLLQHSNASIFDHLRDTYCADYETDGEKDSFLYKNNHSPFLLVAHIDTVTIKKPPLLVIKHNVISNGNGEPLGADDRAGVWAILNILDLCKKRKVAPPSVLFTNGEETGGTGVRAFIKSGIKWTEGVRLMVELDRKGANEWVDYVSVEKQVQTYVESFGYVSGHGSYSDIYDLSLDSMIPGVNLSIGYYSQHTGAERLHVDEAVMCCERVMQMLASPLEKLYPCVYTPRATYLGGKYGQGGSYSGTDDYDFGFDDKWGTSTSYKAPAAKKKKASPFDAADELIASETACGRCLRCGVTWPDCECGRMEDVILDAAYDEKFDLEWFTDTYLCETDILYYSISQICSLEFEGEFEEEGAEEERAEEQLAF